MAWSDATVGAPGATKHTPHRIGSSAIRRLRSAAAVPDSGMLLLAFTLIVAAGGLLILPYLFLQDSWYSLVAGRAVWANGVPHYDLLTRFTHGARWVDQEWLTQLIMYCLYRLGGLRTVGLVHITLIMCAIGGAITAARRLGAPARTISWVLALALATMVSRAEVRVEAYAYPLFVAVFFLLAADSRRPTSRVYACLPLLVLWANIHGSVVLGAGLVCLRGVTEAWDRVRTASSDRKWTRALVLTVLPWMCLMATPYGLSIVTFYRDTLLNSGFHRFIVEWRPVTTVPFVAVPFFLLASILTYVCARRRSGTTLWERCAVLVLLVGGTLALRNVVWLALAALIVLPPAIAELRRRPRRPRTNGSINLAFAASAAVALGVATAATLGRSDGSLQAAYPRGLREAVVRATARDPSVNVLADVRFADWLLWYDPNLRDRIAYDSRFELLGKKRLRQLVAFQRGRGRGWQKFADGYGLVILDSRTSPAAARALSAQPSAKILYRDSGVLAIERRPAPHALGTGT